MFTLRLLISFWACIETVEYKHIVLSLIFLKYISYTLEEMHEKLKTGKIIMTVLTAKIVIRSLQKGILILQV